MTIQSLVPMIAVVMIETPSVTVLTTATRMGWIAAATCGFIGTVTEKNAPAARAALVNRYLRGGSRLSVRGTGHGRCERFRR